MGARKKITKNTTPLKEPSPARNLASAGAGAVVAAKAATKRPVPPPLPQAGAISADAVLLGHVMGLRPRVHVGFKPSAFADAKRALAEERYATLEAAARAVAEKAIELSNEFSPGSPFSRR